jgi:hypothetical protein
MRVVVVLLVLLAVSCGVRVIWRWLVTRALGGCSTLTHSLEVSNKHWLGCGGRGLMVVHYVDGCLVSDLFMGVLRVTSG